MNMRNPSHKVVDKALRKADKFASDFDKTYPNTFSFGAEPPELWAILSHLSIYAEKLDKEILDDIFPRYNAGSMKGVKIGKRAHQCLENQMFGSALILADWLGWVFEGKAIMHYGKARPRNREILQRYVIPMVSEAFGRGIQRAMKEKEKK
jgi:hypothetical protein